MDQNRQKEEFSNAFIQAVSAAAGYGATRPSVDNDSVDWTIAARGRLGSVRSPKIDVQLKCTGVSQIADGDESFRFRLPRKNYDDLRHEDFLVPRILVVVRVPADMESWITESDESLTLRHAAYWVSLRGAEPTENAASVTVRLPLIQRFTVDALQSMMAKIGEGECA